MKSLGTPKLRVPHFDLSNRVTFSEDHREHAVDIGGKHASEFDFSPLPRITLQSFYMGILVSMGGFIFGYDTGEISGFLAMPDFLQRFGQRNHATGEYHFSNVRSGLIVAMLSIGTLIGALVAAPIADRIGRRTSITFWCFIFSVGLIVQISA